MVAVLKDLAISYGGHMHSEKDDYIRPDEIEKLNSLDTQERLIPVFWGGGAEMAGCMEEAIFQKELYR